MHLKKIRTLEDDGTVYRVSSLAGDRTAAAYKVVADRWSWTRRQLAEMIVSLRTEVRRFVREESTP